MLAAMSLATSLGERTCKAQQPLRIAASAPSPDATAMSTPSSTVPSNPQVTIAPLAGNLLTNVQYPLNVTGFTPAVQDMALVKAYPATGANVTWTPIGNKGKATVLFLATQPGSYTIVIAYVLNDGSVATAEQVVTVGGGPTPVNPPHRGRHRSRHPRTTKPRSSPASCG